MASVHFSSFVFLQLQFDLRLQLNSEPYDPQTGSIQETHTLHVASKLYGVNATIIMFIFVSYYITCGLKTTIFGKLYSTEEEKLSYLKIL